MDDFFAARAAELRCALRLCESGHLIKHFPCAFATFQKTLNVFGKVEVRERIRGRPLGGRLREMCGAGEIYIEELVLKFAENSRLIRA
jgi:hypothetical protein